MYLDYFGMKTMPFALTPDTSFYLNMGSHQEALNTLLVGLDNEAGFIKLIGEVGTGKTMLCRMLLNSLPEHFVSAYIPNPHLTPAGMRTAFAEELGLRLPRNEGQHRVLKRISERLIELTGQGKKVVLIIDEAQAIPEETIEALRLMTNLETETQKLLQIVLFGQPELDELLNRPGPRQLKQRITFSHYLKPMNRDQMQHYLAHHLSVAGYNGQQLFVPSALKRLFKASGGVPRLVNILCHKALLVTYGKGRHQVESGYMQRAIEDTEESQGRAWFEDWKIWAGICLLLALAVTLQGVVL